MTVTHENMASTMGKRLSTLMRWMALPWWLLALGTGAKSFCDNPLIGSRQLNRAGLYVQRIRMAHFMARYRRKKLARLISQEDRLAFEQQGYVMVPELLPKDQFAQLKSALMSRAFPTREMTQGDTITRRIAIDAAMLRDIPALAALLQEPRWSGLMRYIASFASEPLYYIQTILTHQSDAPPDPQTRLHIDTFHPSMKAWFFLTDVKENDGALMYVPGSHRMTPQRYGWAKKQSIRAKSLDRLSARGSLRITAEELTELGLPPPVAFAVPANTLVVADTGGFHARGPSLRPTVRVEIWAYCRRNPFLPWAGLDPLSLPMLAPRRVGALWWVRDRLKFWVGQPWTDTGPKLPDSR